MKVNTEGLGRMESSRGSEVIRMAIVAALLTLMPSLASGQVVRVSLSQRVDAFDSNNPSPVGQLIDLAQTLRVPMGIEWLEVANEKPSPPLHMRKTNLQGTLDAILRPYGYAFELRNGIVHIFAPSLILDEKNFLNLRIAQFHVEKVNIFQASYELTNAIQEVLQPSPGYAGGTGHGANTKTGFAVRNITFFVQNSTPRGILDKIIAVQGNALWVVRLKQRKMMDNGRFYAQTILATGGEAAPDFHWLFTPLREIDR